jgi:hypothetical protein
MLIKPSLILKINMKILGFKNVLKLELKGLKIWKIKFKPSPREPPSKFNNAIIKTESFFF